MNAIAIATESRKVGLNKGSPRIWIEGKKLDAAGFTANSRYNVERTGKQITLSLHEEGKRKVSGKTISDTYRHPIIDLHASYLAEFVNAGDMVNVSYFARKIVITK
jgi:DNA (cytosine-5)-methyltransferase 1